MDQNRNTGDREKKPIPVVSRRTQNGTIVEMLFEREASKTSFAVGGDGEPEILASFDDDGRTHVPYSPRNNLLTHRVLLLPSAIGEALSKEELLAEIRAFVHRYVDLPETFEEVAATYVLLTWLYDSWNELPYLRVRGDFGSGKSRFLLTVGSVCWKPIFASGASTVSPIFRLLDEVGGTLVIDEADFWQTDEKAEIVKILNNGNARGFPVLRTEVNAAKEFSPRAFNIFGPKIVATRNAFDDEALESRCLSAVLGQKAPREDVPVSLPSHFEIESEALRNKLLRYRLDHGGRPSAPIRPSWPGLTARRAQVIAPMLEMATDENMRARLCAFAAGDTSRAEIPGARFRAAVLRALRDLRTKGEVLTVGLVARATGATLGEPVSDRQVGICIRQLGLTTHKSNGVYRISQTEQRHLDDLLRQNGLGEVGDIGDIPQGTGDGFADGDASHREGDGERVDVPNLPDVPEGGPSSQ